VKFLENIFKKQKAQKSYFEDIIDREIDNYTEPIIKEEIKIFQNNFHTFKVDFMDVIFIKTSEDIKERLEGYMVEGIHNSQKKVVFDKFDSTEIVIDNKCNDLHYITRKVFYKSYIISPKGNE